MLSYYLWNSCSRKTRNIGFRTYSRGMNKGFFLLNCAIGKDKRYIVQSLLVFNNHFIGVCPTLGFVYKFQLMSFIIYKWTFLYTRNSGYFKWRLLSSLWIYEEMDSNKIVTNKKIFNTGCKQKICIFAIEINFGIPIDKNQIGMWHIN